MTQGQAQRASLVVTLVDHESHRQKRHEFKRSPVRIGRDPGNELHLPYKFVSSWHAVAKFDGRSARVEDLGGANGLTVDGQRVASGGRVEVRGRLTIAIGPIELLFEHKGAEDEPEFESPRPLRGRGKMPEPTPESQLHKRDRLQTAGAIDTDSEEPPSLIQESGTQAMNLSRVHMAVLKLRPLYEKLAEAQRKWDGNFQEVIDELSAGKDRGEVMLLRREFPPLAVGTSEGPAALDNGGAEFYQQAELGAVGQAAEQLLAGLRPPGNVEETRRFLTRVVDTLRTFAVATVELQDLLHRQAGEVGVRIEGEKNPLLVAESDDDLLRYMIDWRVSREERSHQLAEVFAAAMAQVRGVMRGTVVGGQKIGESLSPREIERNVTAAWPTRAGALWRRFEERYEALFGDGDESTSRVFRAAVGRALREELGRAGVPVEEAEEAEEEYDE